MCYTVVKTAILDLYSPVLKKISGELGIFFIVFKWLLFRFSIFDIGGALIDLKDHRC
jgi:hypothetical protein